MEGKRVRTNSKARQLELAWEGRIDWEALPAPIRLHLREELARLLMQLAMGAGVEVDDDDGER